jgi:hypothetical protein
MNATREAREMLLGRGIVFGGTQDKCTSETVKGNVHSIGTMYTAKAVPSTSLLSNQAPILIVSPLRELQRYSDVFRSKFARLP